MARLWTPRLGRGGFGFGRLQAVGAEAEAIAPRPWVSLGRAGGGLRWLGGRLASLAETPVDLFLFLPVLLGIGIGLWFLLPVEPGRVFYGLVSAAILGLVALAMAGPWVLRPWCLAASFLLLGAPLCGFRVWMVATPMLATPYYGPIQGRIIEIDRSQSDAIRLTLDRVALDEVEPSATPATVRVSLHGPAPPRPYAPGTIVLLTARLAAPESASEPGGFDFRRMAWFQQLGAVGYTSSPVMTWERPGPWDSLVNRLRSHLAGAIMAAVPGDSGAFAAGALTGDRSEISAAVVSDLRVSSLAHLLAISGMNMAFITGFVFALIRYGLALVPPLALRLHAKKVAAYVALAVALFYLVLSGANVATTRAFLMVSIMLGAVMLDRRALTLRSVALAALALLAWQPESLLAPGFQLSFAATIALIAGFAPAEHWMREKGVPGLLRPMGLVLVSSVLAGLATAPYAAATFNRLTGYGLMANLLTVPVMDLLMAAGAMAALLAPLGLAGPALVVMDWSARWILFIAHWIAGLAGAITPVVQPGPWVIPLMTLGALWLLIWRGGARPIGVAPVLLGLMLWVWGARPPLLISSDGVLAGVLGPEGRALSAPRGAGFAAESWLANDGDLADPKTAAARPGFLGPKSARSFRIGAVRGLVLTGKTALSRVEEACATADLVLVPLRLGPAGPHPAECTVLDAAYLSQSGALAGRPQGDALLLLPVRAQARIWTGNRQPLPPLLVTPHHALREAGAPPAAVPQE